LRRCPAPHVPPAAVQPQQPPPHLAHAPSALDPDARPRDARRCPVRPHSAALLAASPPAPPPCARRCRSSPVTPTPPRRPRRESRPTTAASGRDAINGRPRTSLSRPPTSTAPPPLHGYKSPLAPLLHTQAATAPPPPSPQRQRRRRAPLTPPALPRSLAAPRAEVRWGIDPPHTRAPFPLLSAPPRGLGPPESAPPAP
jgi:hypothetical protein